MRQRWVTDKHCIMDGVEIMVADGAHGSDKKTGDKVFVLKDRTFFDMYDRLLAGTKPKSVIEVGVFEGGSAILFADRWEEAKIVGLDIREPNPSLAAHLHRLGFADRVSLHYGVSQDDVARVRRIIEAEFPSTVDMVIDDCSHMYGLTRRTFETVFPYLAPGGWYVVEDWAWAHWRDWQDRTDWAGKPALSNLLFELVMTCASSNWMVKDVYVNSSLFAVRKSELCPALGHPFSLSDQYAMRGKPLTLI